MANKQIVKIRNAAILKVIEAKPKHLRTTEFLREVADQFGLTTTSVRKLAVESKLYEVRSKVDWDAIVKRIKAADLPDRREAIIKESKTAKLPVSRIVAKCAESGIDLLPAKPNAIDRAFRLVASFKEQGNIPEAARRCDVSRQYAYMVINKAKQAGLI